jgi:hypothetical protein
MYADDQDFREAYEATKNPILKDKSQWVEDMIHEGLLFKGNQLCILKCSMRGDLLRILVTEHHSQWDNILPQAEFAYNDLVNRSTWQCPF